MRDAAVLPERIRSKFYVADDGCWIWTASRTAKGYGTVGWQGAGRTAHRVVYSLLVGDIPEGHDLDHLCKVTSCVNPEHVEPVTRWENLRRSGAWNLREMCRKNLHPLVEGNLYVRPNGIRRCLTCYRDDKRSNSTKAR